MEIFDQEIKPQTIPEYTIPKGAKNIEEHIGEALKLTKTLDTEIYLVDEDKNIKFSICPTCTHEKVMQDYADALTEHGVPDGSGHGVVNIKTPEQKLLKSRKE